jgi:hypothetical protein
MDKYFRPDLGADHPAAPYFSNTLLYWPRQSAGQPLHRRIAYVLCAMLIDLERLVTIEL